MAERRPVHQQFPFRGGLEAGGQDFDPPLLPYERSLIEAIGCTEDEYKKLVRYAMQKAQVRPAEYDRIPNIVATGVDPLTYFFINLAVGLLLTGVSMLLAPNIPSLEASNKIKKKKLADQVGPSRFNQTTAFDNAPSLAELNQPIPIPFGKRSIGADGVATGGLILVPALVWSRLYAYGNYQAYEGIYVTGEHGVDSPDLAGILLGTQAMNALGNRDFALYWSSNAGNNRPSRLIYGTEGPGATGTSGRPIFTSPTNDGQFSNGFSMAYTPSGDTTFGTSTPIHNGSAFRFNWQVVSAPFISTLGDDNKDARTQKQCERRKIAGTLADVLHIPNQEAGMPGVGRAYSRHMGFISHNGTQYENRTILTINQGDTAVFEIDNRNQVWEELAAANFSGTEINLKDLIAQAKSWRERASTLLAIGTKWIIGDSSWVVTSRQVAGEQTFITFECVALLGVSKFGIAGRRTVEEPLGGYEGDVHNDEKHCGAAFFNVCRLNVATIRPVRKDADVIELGIRSQVWNKAEGLCNFNAIPSPQELFRLDESDTVLETGRISKYFKRSSCFSLWVRPVQEYGQAQQTWVRVPEVFCVQGSAPISQYNYLRIRPRISGFYEYRLIPRTGSDIAINSIDTNTAIVLDSNDGTPYAGAGFGRDYDTPYGSFRITTQGREVSIKTLRLNDELQTTPEALAVNLAASTAVASIAVIQIYANNYSPYLIKNAWITSILGLARDFPGQTRSANITVNAGGGRTVTLNVFSTSIYGTRGVNIGDMYLQANNGSPYIFRNIGINVVKSTGTFNVGDTFNITRNVSGNPFQQRAASVAGSYSTVTFGCMVTSVAVGSPVSLQAGERVFEHNSQVADCSHFTEITKSNESGPEHEIVYVDEFITNQNPAYYDGMSTLGLSVKSSGEIAGIEQVRLWSESGIPVDRLIEGDKNPSNLFADLVYYLLTNKAQGVGNLVPAELVDKNSLVTTAKFLQANGIFYDGVLEDSESFRNFLYDTAPLQLCTFTIKNGRFGMQPALPFDPTNHQISLQPIEVEQIFTAGNIVEGSLKLQYIDISQRTTVRALVSWRVPVENNLPYQASALMTWADLSVDKQSTTEQAFDLTEFCTNREQALRTARFLMSVRRRVMKTVSFQTVPDALGVQPGSYIRVITEASTYSSAANGAITDAGTLVSITTIEDGTYNALVYNPGSEDVIETELVISGNQISDSTYHGSLFTLLSTSTDYSIYQIEELTLEEDGLVSISAVEVPTDESGVSIVAKDVLTESNFTILE